MLSQTAVVAYECLSASPPVRLLTTSRLANKRSLWMRDERVRCMRKTPSCKWPGALYHLCSPTATASDDDDDDDSNDVLQRFFHCAGWSQQAPV